MKHLFVVFVTVLLTFGCTEKKVEEPQSNARLEQMLVGLWISDEDESVAFMAKGDTLYYPDASMLPAHFRIYGDTMFVDGASKARYFIEKLTPNAFQFRNQNGESVRLVKTDNPDYEAEFYHEETIEDVNQQLVKRDTVVMAGNKRYHCYVQVNPTTYKVVKNMVNDEGMGVGKVYYDNIVNLTVYDGGTRLYSRDFHKQDFGQYVPSNILSLSILSDILFDHCDADGVMFQAQLRIPESPASYIANIQISPTGEMILSQPQ